MTQVNAEDYTRLAAKLKTADKAIARGIRKRLRAVAKPTGTEVVARGSEDMPATGGLRARLQGSRVTVSLTARAVAFRLGKKGAYLAGPEKGTVRHPVFGHRKAWAGTSVPAGTYSSAFQDQAAKVQAALAQEVEAVMRELS